MNPSDQRCYPKTNSLWLPITTVIVFVMALTGFGQMPIYKRYYLADIPGLTWLANFYTTRFIHYVGAVALLALLAYILFNHILSRKHHPLRITRFGYIGSILMAGLVVTGTFFTIKNLPGVFFSSGAVHMINLGHLGFAMLFSGYFLLALVFRFKWVRSI